MQIESIKDTTERLYVDEMISLADLCKDLSISIATGRNWIKLGKLTPTTQKRKNYYFSVDSVSQIKSSIKKSENKTLKARRNKKYISGNNIYNSYISDSSVNTSIIQSIMDILHSNSINITDDIMIGLLTDCAVQLTIARTSNPEEAGNIYDYLNKKYIHNPYIPLIDDLAALNKNITAVVKDYPMLFHVAYQYETGEDILGLLYLSLKNLGNRKATGSYFTPNNIAKKLCQKIFSINDYHEKTILDPCCGTGNFILQLPPEIDYSNVYGNDIDPVSLKIARINFALKYLVSDKEILFRHITETDYLSFSNEKKYDFIIGNPPWGYVFSDSVKEQLRKKYISANGSNIESYDVFIEQAIHNLKVNGVLSFVLPEAVLNVKAHSEIRKVILCSNSFQYIEFLGNVFDKVQCPCIIFQMLHTDFPLSTTGMTVHDGTKEFSIMTQRPMTDACFSFLISDEEYSILNKLEKADHMITLAGQADFALGIVTGNNKEYLSSKKHSNHEGILKGSDLCKFKYHEPTNYIIFKPESFQQIAPVRYYRAKEKLFYRFICNQLVFAYDDAQTLSLNSCNIVIPNVKGLAMKYIMAVLNSRIAQFYFTKQFHSVKVLRSHIEQIPIPYVNETEQEKIIKYVERILCSSQDEIAGLYDNMDEEISRLYQLTADEYAAVRSVTEGENLFLQ
ncbi:MAG: N-6 DNA methylase [Lachnospiraceae bacterium]|nr:N-6 DNA methylase [Lachnospiraceae bacterium]